MFTLAHFSYDNLAVNGLIIFFGIIILYPSYHVGSYNHYYNYHYYNYYS